MVSDTKAIKKLKKNSQKWSEESGFAGFKSRILQSLPSFFILWLLRNVLVKSDYRLKRESIKFFQFSNRAYGKKSHQKCDRLLVVALLLIDSSISVQYLSLLRRSVRYTLADPLCRRECSESILLATRQLDANHLDATGWYQLSRGLFSLGYFRAAWVARENSLNLSILESESDGASSNALNRGIQAYFERANLDSAKELLVRAGQSIPPKTVTQIQENLAIMGTNFQQPIVEQSLTQNLGKSLFRNLVCGRTVAIVGPGEVHGDYGDEIDEFDTVVRMKFIGDEMLDKENRHGSKRDISYIGSLESIGLLVAEKQDLLGNLKLILSTRASVLDIGHVPVYSFQNEGMCYRSSSTSGLRTLLEVIRNAPAKVKVFGFDFYATSTPYSEEMTNFYEKFSWKFGHPNDFVADGAYFRFARAHDFSNHDSVSNFCLAQNLYKAGLFDIEPYGKSILELTPYQYVERLEEMLGDW